MQRGEQRRLGGVERFGEHLAEKSERFVARPPDRPALAIVVDDCGEQVIGEEEFEQRGVREAEDAAAAAVDARQEGRVAQVFFELVGVQARVAALQVGLACEPGVEPALDLLGRQAAVAALPEVGGEVAREQQLVLRTQVVLAAVAFEPASHQAAVERDAIHFFAGQALVLDFGDEFGDQAQGVRALRQFAQVMHRAHGGQQLLDVAARQRRGEVVLHLFFVERQQNQRAVGSGALFAALLAGKVILLFAQRAEKLRAAGDQPLERAACAARFVLTRQRAQQLAGEGLPVGFGQPVERFVEAVEDDDGAGVEPAFEVGVAIGFAALRQIPAARDALLDDLAERRHAPIEPGDVAQVEIERQRQRRIAHAALVEHVRQPLAGDRLAHAVFAEQREERRRFTLVDPAQHEIHRVDVRALFVRGGDGVFFHARMTTQRVVDQSLVIDCAVIAQAHASRRRQTRGMPCRRR